MTSPLLVTVSGPDRPGVTSALLESASRGQLEVVDIEQVVLRGRLVLGFVLAGVRDEATVRGALHARATELGMDIEIRSGQAEPPNRPGRSHVTVLAARLTPTAVAGIAGRIADLGANIDRIVRMARSPVTAVELEVSGVQPAALRAALAPQAASLGVDLAVQPAGLMRRAKHLVVMDVDSTLIQGEVIEMIAARAGCEEQVAAVTAAAMRGELDFAEALGQRVALLAGLDAAVLDEVRAGVKLAPGARTLVRTLKRLDHRVGIVSGGFTQVTDALAADLGLDYAAANTLEVIDGRLTGRLVGPVVDRAGKAAALRRFAADAGVALSQTVAIGDGANDLDMLALAGLGVAFNAKPIVRQAADTSVSLPYLDSVLFLLGVTREEIEAADAADGVG